MSKPIKDWDQFAQVFSNHAREPQGSGWLTRDEIEKKFKIGMVKARKTIRALVTSGKMEQFVGSQINSAGRLSAQFWYRPKK